MIRDLLDRATAWEQALTEAGFDVLNLEVATLHHRRIGICIAGDEDALRSALTVLGLSEGYGFTTCLHRGTSTLPPHVTHISSHSLPDAYVRIDASRPATEAEIAEMDAEGGEPRG